MNLRTCARASLASSRPPPPSPPQVTSPWLPSSFSPVRPARAALATTFEAAADRVPPTRFLYRSRVRRRGSPRYGFSRSCASPTLPTVALVSDRARLVATLGPTRLFSRAARRVTRDRRCAAATVQHATAEAEHTRLGRRRTRGGFKRRPGVRGRPGGHFRRFGSARGHARA